MGHHLTDDGQFKSDRHPDLPAGKIVLSFKDPHAQLGLWVTAMDYRAHDPELSADMVAALSRLGSAPPRAAVEDAWAQSLARERGVDPRETVRVFPYLDESGLQRFSVVGGANAVDEFVRTLCFSGEPFTETGVDQHRLVADVDAPPRSATDDGRPDFDGFLLALRAERHWSAALHSEDNTGQAAADQRALHELAEHVERAGKALGFLGQSRLVPNRPKDPSLAELTAAVDEAGFRVAKNLAHPFLGPTPGDRSTLWCKECGRDSGYHWEGCSKLAVQMGGRLEAEQRAKRGVEGRDVTASRVHTVDGVRGPLVVDYRDGMKQKFVLHGSVSLSLVPPPGLEGATTPPVFVLVFEQDEEGGHTVEWPSDVHWPQSTYEISERADDAGTDDDHSSYEGEYKTRRATPEEHAQAMAVRADPRWSTLFSVACMPGGLYASGPLHFEP